ncbi:MAG: hypothetical protein ACE15E_08615 [Acidobacteriota bacterium]
MKKSYWIVGTIGVGFLFLGVIVNFLMSFAASRAADRFFDQISDGHPSKAYAMTTRSYREATTATEFARMIRLWNLKQFTKEDDWETQSGKGQVTLTGSLKTRTGQLIPMRMKLIKEDGEWRVASLQGPPPPQIHYRSYINLGHWQHRRDGSKLPVNPPPVLADAEVERLVRATLLDLDKALDKEDFEEFHASVAEAWRETTPLVVFNRVLLRLNNSEMDLGAVAKAKPVFEKPVKVRADGVLAADGKYLLSPHALDFWLHYVQEDDKQWRLISLRLGWRNLSLAEIDDEEGGE